MRVAQLGGRGLVVFRAPPARNLLVAEHIAQRRISLQGAITLKAEVEIDTIRQSGKYHDR